LWLQWIFGVEIEGGLTQQKHKIRTDHSNNLINSELSCHADPHSCNTRTDPPLAREKPNYECQKREVFKKDKVKTQNKHHLAKLPGLVKGIHQKK
jgi:hypothetical protein